MLFSQIVGLPLVVLFGCLTTLAYSQESDSAGSTLSGDLMLWHRVSVTITGPQAAESDNRPNPFADYRLTVRFSHESGTPSYEVPGYFAADGNAGESSADAGNRWQAHFRPDKPGLWKYHINFVRGEDIAVDLDAAGKPAGLSHGSSGQFTIEPTDKSGRDFRARGRLEYARQRYLHFAGDGRRFIKTGVDSPETLLAYQDFDGTKALKKSVPLKTWAPHARDWRPGDPTWQSGKGKGLIGAVNYLSEYGANSISFIPYNVGGDGDNVWPMIAADDKRHYDCSKLAQWQIVFDHCQTRGVFLHFKLQENENDDNRLGDKRRQGSVEPALDGGKLGIERKLYLREMVARFGYELALNWNLGEENTQSSEEQRTMASFLHKLDPYDHLIVVHTFPGQQDRVYSQLLGEQSELSGASLQNSWSQSHERTLKWIKASTAAGKPWVVSNDEQNPADQGVPPDPGYEGFDGLATEKGRKYTLDDIRKQTLWGTLMAGGAGVEYYFGYKLPQNDLRCEDFRSREQSWKYCRIARKFFEDQALPLEHMTSHDELVGNPRHDHSRYCLAKLDETYLVYLPTGGEAKLNFGKATGQYSVQWFNPREGGSLVAGKVNVTTAGGKTSLGSPPREKGEDWVVLVNRVHPRGLP